MYPTQRHAHRAGAALRIAPLTMKHILTGSTQRTRISTMRRIAEELGMSLTQLLELSREDALDKM